jgi:anthranilate synthase/aminodeoxychorismate synthase-like glutamine amidotransferase
VLVVDHHDSFTYNLVHLITVAAGCAPTVISHDAVEACEVLAGGFTHIVLSPGPGHPSRPGDFVVGRDLLLRAPVPVLGVCLGHQGLVESFGGTVGHVAPAHGEVARVHHDGQMLFAGVPQDFAAVRYHSFAAKTLPDDLVVTAWTPGESGPVVMGVRHRHLPFFGLQFHPESVMTEHGALLMTNFLRTLPATAGPQRPARPCAS